MNDKDVLDGIKGSLLTHERKKYRYLGQYTRREWEAYYWEDDKHVEDVFNSPMVKGLLVDIDMSDRAALVRLHIEQAIIQSILKDTQRELKEE